jgi:transcriptional regulator with XRE-family HTH domain
MKLNEWTSSNNVKPRQLAAMLGLTYAAAHRYINGKRLPEPDVMKRIAEITANSVTPNDFILTSNEPRPTKPRRK